MQPTIIAALRRISRFVALFVVAALFGGLALAIPATGAHAAVVASSGGPGEKFGFATGADILWNRTPAEQAAELDTIASAGTKWVRFDISWDTVQPFGPAWYDWSQPDRLVLAANARGLHALGVLTYTPQWARQARCSNDRACPPADDGQFAAYARAAAVHYGSSVTAWEVWNEPNWEPFWRSPNAADYVALLKPTYTAIKSVQPNSTVVSGGLAPYGDLNRTAVDPLVALSSPVNFVTAMYAAGARGYFDALGHHPYAYPYAPMDCCAGWNAVLQTPMLHAVMAANGDGSKPIWGTEAGAPTAGPSSVSEAQQADWVRQYVQMWNNWSFTGPLMFFSVRDLGTSSNNTDHFGFTRVDLSPKPAYTALIQSLAAIGGMGPIAGATGVSPFVKVGAPSQAVAVRAAGGYYVMSSTGRVEAFGGAPYYGAPSFPPGLAKDMAVMPDGAGYVVLDAWGGVHRFGSASNLQSLPDTYWPGWDIARSIKITPDGKGLAVLDGWGGVHWAGGTVNLQAGWWKGWDIARALALTPDGRGIYVLDAWGGIHTAGTASYRGGPFWPGWDIARDIVVTPSGNGYAVLDGFGGIHPVGDAPTQVTPGFTSGDTWRSLALKPS